jgi:SM-20-related protein
MRYLLMDALPTPKVYIARAFFDQSLCQRLCQAMREGGSSPATITLGDLNITDAGRRRTNQVAVSDVDRRIVEDRLVALAPTVVQYFDLKLSGLQRAQFLRYQRGDFFRPHQDLSSHPTHGVTLRSRRISTVLFLNRQSRLPEDEAYCGGELRLFKVDDHPDPVCCVTGEPGLLVAFASEVLHEVRPVTHGERYTVVSWYTHEGT